MEIYPAKSAIDFYFELEDDDGNPIENVASVKFKVIDSDSNVVIAEQEYAFGEDAPKNELLILIPAEANELAEETARDIRVVCVTVTTENGGQILLEKAYGLTVADPLIFGVNSFMTYRQSLRVSMDMPNLKNWEQAPISQKISALLESKLRICRLSFDMSKANLDMSKQNYEVQVAGRPRSVKNGDPFDIMGEVRTLRDFTVEDFEKLPKPFLTALRMAQLAEANDILETDSITERRRQGLILETIGEVKQMFSSVLPAQTVVSSRAMSYLSPYLSASRKIGRA